MTTYYPPGNLALTEGFLVERATAALPATTTANIFTITGGRIIVRGLVGQVTTAIQAQANAVKIVAMKSNLLWMKNDIDQGLMLNAGAIALTTAATSTGSVAWSLFYVPIDAGVTVAAA
jgi:hypothetical protein